MSEERITRTLTIQAYHVTQVHFGERFQMEKNNDSSLENTYTLTLPSDASSYFPEQDLIKSLTVRLILPEEHHVLVGSIMDVFPISVKALGKIGEGTTKTITGLYGMITGMDENDVPVCAFGNSNGYLDEHMTFDMAGTPSSTDLILCFDAILKAGAGASRSGPDSVHYAVDTYTQKIREVLKLKKGNDCTEKHTYQDIIHPNRKKVVLVKNVSGQGAMYDTHYLANEPSGFIGSYSIIDDVGAPVLLSPNEYRDGAIRALYG